MTDQQRQLLDADARFQALLQQRSLTGAPIPSTAGQGTSSLPHYTQTRAAEVKAAIHEALDRQNDSGSPTPTIRGTVYNPMAPEFHPTGQQGGQQGVQSSAGGAGFNPEVEEFRPSGQQGGQPGKSGRGPGH